MGGDRVRFNLGNLPPIWTPNTLVFFSQKPTGKPHPPAMTSFKRVAFVSTHLSHYELLPAFLQYAEELHRTHGTECVFYLSSMNPIFADWHYWLTSYAGMSFQVQDAFLLHTLRRGDFDVFFTLSDDDPWVQTLPGPVVCLAHQQTPKFAAPHCTVRCFPTSRRLPTHHLSPREQTPPAPPAPKESTLPCFKPPSTSDPPVHPTPQRPLVSACSGKQHIHQILVVGVGNGSCLDIPVLGVFLNRPDVQVTLLSPQAMDVQRLFGGRGLRPIYIPEAPTFHMMNLLQTTDAVLIPRTGEYISDRLAGVLPHALSYGVPIIMPESMRAALGVPSELVLTYTRTHPNLPEEMERVLGELVESAPELEDIWAYRDETIRSNHQIWTRLMEEAVQTSARVEADQLSPALEAGVQALMGHIDPSEAHEMLIIGSGYLASYKALRQQTPKAKIMALDYRTELYELYNQRLLLFQIADLSDITVDEVVQVFEEHQDFHPSIVCCHFTDMETLERSRVTLARAKHLLLDTTDPEVVAFLNSIGFTPEEPAPGWWVHAGNIAAATQGSKPAAPGSDEVTA